MQWTLQSHFHVLCRPFVRVNLPPWHRLAKAPWASTICAELFVAWLLRLGAALMHLTHSLQYPGVRFSALVANAFPLFLSLHGTMFPSGMQLLLPARSLPPRGVKVLFRLTVLRYHQPLPQRVALLGSPLRPVKHRDICHTNAGV